MSLKDNVVSIRDKQDWRTMSSIRGSLNFYLENNQTGKYNKALEREGNVYQEYFGKYKIGVKE